jgi:hypothetical protein
MWQKLNLNNQSNIPLDIKKDKQSSPFFIFGVGNGVTSDYCIDTDDSGFLSLSNTYMEIFKTHNAGEISAIG